MFPEASPTYVVVVRVERGLRVHVGDLGVGELGGVHGLGACELAAGGHGAGRCAGGLGSQVDLGQQFGGLGQGGLAGQHDLALGIHGHVVVRGRRRLRRGRRDALLRALF